MANKLAFLPFFLMFLLAACGTSSQPTAVPQQDASVETTVAAVTPSLTAAVATSEASPTSAPAVADVEREDGDISQSLGNADVLFVEARLNQDGTYSFAVTVAHEDTGWEDYADGWDVVMPDGTVVKPDPDSPFTRLLLHPHVDEQPFTRSQGGIAIPQGIDVVTVRAHDLVDGFGGKEVTVDLSADEGPGFEVIR